MIVSYMISGILETLWLGGFNFIFMMIFWICFILLSTWLTTKYSGQYPDLGQYIDHFADLIWTHVNQRKQRIH